MFELIDTELKLNSDKFKADKLQKYFKTGNGEYGEGDIFLGLSLDFLNQTAKKYKDIEFKDIKKLLKSKYHEERTFALIILVKLYKNKKTDKKKIVDFYLNNLATINNWDLVDMSCYKILGDYLFNYKNKNWDILRDFSKSKNLWERRISIVSTMFFVKNNYFEPTIQITKTLLKNEHDLINKATSWLLRKIGKKDIVILREFLRENIKDISSTTLSYATEKFDKSERDELRLLRKM